MRKSNIRLGLSKLRPTGVLALLRRVWTAMTENATLFSDPPVPMTDMGTKAAALAVAIDNASLGGRSDREHRDALVVDAGNVLRKQADYQRMVCAGSADLLSKGGFDLSREPKPVGIPTTPQDMIVKMTGRSGEVELKFKSVYGADSYQIWMAEEDPKVAANWQPVGVAITRTRHLVDNLESFKVYWFSVSAIGAAGESAKSDPAMGRAA